MSRKPAFLHLLLSLCFVIFITFSSVQGEYQPQSSVPGFDCYRDFDSIVQSLQAFDAEYPELAQLSTIGNSWEGRPIYVLTLTNEARIEDKPRLVLVSGLRANAFAPVELSLRFAEKLLADYGENSESGWLLDHFELHLILLANPDGRARAEDQAIDGPEYITWQNNTHNSCSSEDIGVRLNQNFPYEWRSSDACDPAYSGEFATSELETQAIINYLQILSAQPKPILLLNLDSYKNEILSPYLSKPTADNPHLEDLYTLAEKIGYDTLSGPVRQGGDPSQQPSFGTLVDYAYGTLGIPSLVFSMGDELAGGYTSYCWYFEENLLERNINALTRALKVSSDPYQQSYGPEIEIGIVSQDINRVIVEGSANDYLAWFGGADLYSQVQSVQYSIDLPPWHPEADLQPVSGLVQDADYDFISHFSLEIDYSSFTPGYHRIFLQAWDTEADGNSSNPGLIEAVDIFIPYQCFIPLVNSE